MIHERLARGGLAASGPAAVVDRRGGAVRARQARAGRRRPAARAGAARRTAGSCRSPTMSWPPRRWPTRRADPARRGGFRQPLRGQLLPADRRRSAAVRRRRALHARPAAPTSPPSCGRTWKAVFPAAARASTIDHAWGGLVSITRTPPAAPGPRGRGAVRPRLFGHGRRSCRPSAASWLVEAMLRRRRALRPVRRRRAAGVSRRRGAARAAARAGHALVRDARPAVEERERDDRWQAPSTDDQTLGMDRAIDRRDFLNGVAVAVGALGAGLRRGGRAQAAPAWPQDRAGLLSARADRPARQPSRLVRGRPRAARRRLLAASAGAAGHRRALRPGRRRRRHQRPRRRPFLPRRPAGRPHPDPRQPRRLRRPRQAQRVPSRRQAAPAERRHAGDRQPAALQRRSPTAC